MISYSICRGHLHRQPHFLSFYIGLAISWTFSSIMGLESLVHYFLFEVSNAPSTKWVLWKPYSLAWTYPNESARTALLRQHDSEGTRVNPKWSVCFISNPFIGSLQQGCMLYPLRRCSSAVALTGWQLVPHSPCRDHAAISPEFLQSIMEIQSAVKYS